MIEELRELIKIKALLEDLYEKEDSFSELSTRDLKLKAFIGMASYLKKRTLDKSIALIDTILEEEDLRKEVTIIHTDNFKDMDKFCEILGESTPNDSDKIKKINENVNTTLEFIKEKRAEKAANV